MEEIKLDVKEENSQVTEIPVTVNPTESSPVISAGPVAVKESETVPEILTEPLTRHEGAIPYERFKEVNEAKKEAERRAIEAEVRLQQMQETNKPKQYSLEELQQARKHWIREGDIDKAMEIADMIADRKSDEKARILAADFEDRYRAESDNPDLKDKTSDLYRETTKVFNEMGNLTRSQAAEIAYARLSKAGKISKPVQPRFEPKGQLGSGTTQEPIETVSLTQDEIDFCRKAGLSVDRYKESKKEPSIAVRRA